MLIRDVKEGRNHVLFGLDDLVVLYERVGNTIHTGKDEDLSQIISFLETTNYSPKFTSKKIKEKPHKFSQLVLSVTDSCNLACGYCIYSGKYEGERVNSDKFTIMPDKTAFTAVDIFAANAKDESAIGFYGGEPTLAFDLIKKVVNYTKERYEDKKFTFSFTSNFFAVEPHLNYLADEGFNVTVSIDGPEHVQNKWRVTKKKKPTFGRVMDNLRKLRSIDPEYFKLNVCFSSVYTSDQDLIDSANFFRNNDLFRGGRVISGAVQTMLLNDPSIIGELGTNAWADFLSELKDEYIANLISGKVNYSLLCNYFDLDVLNIRRREITYVPTLLTPSVCYPSDRKLFVSIDGSFHTCEKVGLNRPIGSVEHGLDTARIDSLLEEFVDIKNEVCSDCWGVRLCPSCLTSAKAEDGLSAGSLKMSCGGNKARLLDGLGIYVSLVQKDLQKNCESYFSNLVT